jgi:hypothetical protein
MAIALSRRERPDNIIAPPFLAEINSNRSASSVVIVFLLSL